MTLRALVADESAAFSRDVKQALEMIPGVEVVGLCRRGPVALEKMRTDKPDLVMLDVDLPELDGLAVLQAWRKEGMKTAVVMMSARDPRDLAGRALELGALDCIGKAGCCGTEEGVRALRERLLPLVSAAAHRQEVQSILRRGGTGRPAGADPPLRDLPPRVPEPVRSTGGDLPHVSPCRAKPAMVLIGVSTGGPAALAQLIPALPSNLRVPVLIVQHMPPMFTQNLAQKLDSSSGLHVLEAHGGEVAAAGTVYIAPGGKHLKVMAGVQREIVLRTTADPPENNCRPAVDVLFRSAAAAFPGLAVAVILTGMGRDGTLGLRALRTSGVHSIAQDEASCTVFGMPKEAIQAGLVDVVAPLDAIAGEIVKAVC